MRKVRRESVRTNDVSHGLVGTRFNGPASTDLIVGENLMVRPKVRELPIDLVPNGLRKHVHRPTQQTRRRTIDRRARPFFFYDRCRERRSLRCDKRHEVALTTNSPSNHSTSTRLLPSLTDVSGQSTKKNSKREATLTTSDYITRRGTKKEREAPYDHAMRH
jgi:hypothetical protein